eukprot:TRINITY_DN2180_c0_g1_i1.p2 TRINITY_DN2180_c0_g1~~TRINITY_DN2180_c0_g1_i1.p2  ORF type:complete len:161 (-),score=65.41 TRINITY_DN2180_c0_g1_i1:42-524(-)
MTSNVADYGGETDKYKWVQTKDEMTVTIDVGEGLRGKDINVKWTANTLQAGVIGQPLIIDGNFPAGKTIDNKSSCWTKDGNTVEITLYKSNTGNEDWWNCVVVQDADKDGGSIDLELIDASKYLDDSLLKKVKESKAQKKEEERLKAAQEASATQEEKTD